MRVFDNPIGYGMKLPKGIKLFYRIASGKYEAFVTLAKTSSNSSTGYMVRLDEIEKKEISNNSHLNELKIGDVFLAGANELFFWEMDEI